MFGPTSPLLAWLCAAGALALACVGAHNMSLRRPLVRACSTVRCLLLAGMLVAAAGGIAVNRSLGYMPTWQSVVSTITGTENGPVRAVVEKTAPAYTGSAAPIPQPEGAAWHTHFTKEHNVLLTTFTGPESGITQQVRVWLPADYTPSRMYKVIVMLHGFPGNPSRMARTMDFDHVVPRSAPGTIVVIPSQFPDAASPDCLDVAGRPAVSTWITDDVVGMVRANFSTSANREDWAIGGASYGGWCAGELALARPDRFGSAIMFSGYNQPETGSLTRSTELRKAYTITKLMRESSWPQRFYIAATAHDRDAYALVTAAENINNPAVAVTTHVDSQGAHNWSVWAKQAPAAFTWWSTHAGPSKNGGHPSHSQGALLMCAAAVLLAAAVLGASAWRGVRWRRGTRALAAAVGVVVVVLAVLGAVNTVTLTVLGFEDIPALLGLVAPA